MTIQAVLSVRFFEKLQDLNLSLQERNCNLFTLNDKIKDFIKKINI